MEKMLYTKNVRIKFAEQNCASCSRFFDGYPTAKNLRILCHEKVCIKLFLSNVIREMGRNLDLDDSAAPQAQVMQREPRKRP
jgi:hypothetical protein